MLCVGCAQAPGGPVGELVTSTESARSGVLTVGRALTAWRDERLPRTAASVAVDDAISTVYDAVGVVVALDVETERDESRRIGVQQRLSRAVDSVVRARAVLDGDRDSPTVQRALNDLHRIGDDLHTASERLSS